MQSPYTSAPLDAIMAAQSSLGVALTAIVFFRPLRPWLASALILGAVWTSVLMPVVPEFLHGIGLPVEPTFDKDTLNIAAVMAALAMLVASPRWIFVPALGGAVVLRKITEYIEQSDGELAALHLIFCGALLGMYWAATLRPSVGAAKVDLSARRFRSQDAMLATLAIGMAALVSTYVLERSIDSADEWAYTYQAAVFAKGRVYGTVPHCETAFQSFWVFSAMGREFSQYTPGWPMFMIPFVWTRAVWLAGPFSFGLLVVGVARVTRRIAAAGHVRDAAPSGVMAALSLMLSSTMLINGGSRFPHIFVAGTFAWAIEAVCVVTEKGASTRRQTVWGLLLGTCVGLCIATRPPDGILLALGTSLYAAYALARRRIGWRAVATSLGSLAFWCGVTLVILRLQLGEWFKTGYSLTTQFHPWNVIGFSLPHPSEFKWPLPLATGSYCWWPCAPALGIAGLLAAPRGARHIVFMILASSTSLAVFYMYSEVGRNVDFGYGPRYELHTIVPMAIGGGVLLGRMWRAGQDRFTWRRPFQLGGPMAVAIAAALIGAVRIAPLVYPHNHQDIENRTVVARAITRDNLHHAIVFVPTGTAMSAQLDLTQNMPLELYENDVLVAIEYGPSEVQCVRENYRGWKLYRASGRMEIVLRPL